MDIEDSAYSDVEDSAYPDVEDIVANLQLYLFFSHTWSKELLTLFSAL